MTNLEELRNTIRVVKLNAADESTYVHTGPFLQIALEQVETLISSEEQHLRKKAARKWFWVFLFWSVLLISQTALFVFRLVYYDLSKAALPFGVTMLSLAALMSHCAKRNGGARENDSD